MSFSFNAYDREEHMLDYFKNWLDFIADPNNPKFGNCYVLHKNLIGEFMNKIDYDFTPIKKYCESKGYTLVLDSDINNNSTWLCGSEVHIGAFDDYHWLFLSVVQCIDYMVNKPKYGRYSYSHYTGSWINAYHICRSFGITFSDKHVEDICRKFLNQSHNDEAVNEMMEFIKNEFR